MKKINSKSIQNQFFAVLSLFFFFLLVVGCKKIHRDSETINWDVKKVEIANKVKQDLKNLKALIPFTISKTGTGNILFNNQKLNEYYNVSSTVPNTVALIKAPASVKEIIDGIDARKLSSEPIPVEPGDDELPFSVDVLPMTFLEGGFRQLYWDATNQYTNLESYLLQLNVISSDLQYASYVSTTDKVMIFTEIEFLKQFATDLETNPDYWIDLYAPPIPEPTSNASVVVNTKLKFTSSDLPKVMTLQHREGCKINTRDVLAGAVVAGFTNAIFGVKAGIVAGTFVVPGFGTVTGAVSGFMAGFAVGFTTGVVTGVIASVITCRPR